MAESGGVIPSRSHFRARGVGRRSPQVALSLIFVQREYLLVRNPDYGR